MKAFAMFAASALLVLGISATNAASTTKAKTTPAHSPESIECSKQADAKGLHGKERKEFRSKCKKELKGEGKTTPANAPSPPPTPKSETPAPKSQ